MRTRSIKHIHKYQGTTLGPRKYPIYKCIRPGCGHYIAKELGLGRECLCHKCDDKMIIEGRKDKLPKKPLCRPCRGLRAETLPQVFKKTEIHETAMDIVNDILAQVGVGKK